MKGINEFRASDTVSSFILEKYSDVRIPFTAGIELTAKCNYQCIHCYAKPNRIEKDMSNLQIKHIIDDLVNNGTIELFFTGGECLIRPDFLDIYLYAKKKGLMVSVLTNASLLSEEICSVFKEYPISELSITMYGYTKNVYESITGCSGSYDKFMNAIDLIKKYELPCQFKVMGMKPNLHEVMDMIDFGRKNGFKVLYAFDMRPMVNLDNSPVKLRVTPDEVCWFDYNEESQIELLNNVAKKYPREKDEIDERRRKGFLFPCLIGKQFVFINCQGKMQGCVKYSSEQYDLLHGVFEEGWEFIGEIRSRKADDSFPCTNCKNFDYCEQCTANHILENNDENTPVSFYCDVAQKKAEHIWKIRKDLGVV